MLRYFYILISIQVCFCSIYFDNSVDYDVIGRKARSGTTKVHRRATRNPKKSRMVQFDVQDFVQRSEAEDLNDGEYYGDRKRKSEYRFAPANDVGFVETRDAEEKYKISDYSNLEDNSMKLNTRINLDKTYNPRYFNYNLGPLNGKTYVKDPHERNKLSSDDRILEDPEKKCSFKHMKIPFFSRNKPVTKVKQLRKRKLFCFHCKKTTTPTLPHFTTKAGQNVEDQNMESKPNEFGNDTPNSNTMSGRINKRAYGPLCPRCIKELFFNFKKKTKTTKKVKNASETQTNNSAADKKRTTKQRVDLEDSFQDGYNDNVRDERVKRSDDERERRLKELEEVERKIDNVHITPPYFNSASTKLTAP